MRPFSILIAAAVVVAVAPIAAAAAPAVWPGPAFPNFRTAAQVKAACDRGLSSARQQVRRLERLAPGPGWIAAMDDLNAHIEDVSGPIFVLTSVHPDKALRTATEACELRWQDFSSSLGQNEALYRAARKVRPKDAIDREFLKSALEGFEDAGVSLPPAQRRRAKAHNDRMTALSQAFEKNVRDGNVQVAFTEAELQGVPPTLWAAAKRDAQGRILLPVDDATYLPVLQNAVDPAARERFWRADNGKGGLANLKLLAELGRLRQEYAGLFGAASYADFSLRRRMARDAASAGRFLGDVGQAVGERERVEVEDLRRAKAQALGLVPASVTLERWDAAFYTERLRRARFSVDQEAFREHFPAQQSLAAAMRMAETMFGIRYTRVDGLTLWHPEVQAYAVSDAASGKPLAGLLVDLYPRDGKGTGAFVWSFRNSSTRQQRLPQAVLVTNLDRRGLTLEDFGETLLHEFGHALHNNLSATRHASQGGTNVLRDFVEAPSQMLEDWVYDRDVLGLMQQVCSTCKPVPEALFREARAAKRFGQGIRYARQALYAGFDLSMHGAQAPEPMALWARMESATPLGHVPGTIFPAGFGHVAGGYAAGYYGYLWSEVLAADLRTAFTGKRLDPAVGRRYRESVLARGGERPPQELVNDFLGRNSDAKAFYEELKR
ncbi:MAG: M3 family metallopeptidase [Burkholderiaceae bacterium]